MLTRFKGSAESPIICCPTVVDPVSVIFLSRDEHGREVPRCESGNNPNRFMKHLKSATRRSALDDAPINAPGFFRVPAKLIDTKLPLAPCLGEGLARFKGDLTRSVFRGDR